MEKEIDPKEYLCRVESRLHNMLYTEMGKKEFTHIDMILIAILEALIALNKKETK